MMVGETKNNKMRLQKRADADRKRPLMLLRSRILLLPTILVALCLQASSALLVSAFVVKTPSRANHHPHFKPTTRAPFVLLEVRPCNKRTSLGATAIRRATSDKITESATSANTQTTISQTIPFIVEALPAKPNPALYGEIATMCITAFFNDGNPSFQRTMPWKEVQLQYLRRLQQADLRRRREGKSSSNVMLVARRVIPANAAKVRTTTPLILDTQSIYNWNSPGIGNGDNNVDLVRGEVLGFVEVTNKPYGLGLGSTPAGEDQRPQPEQLEQQNGSNNKNNNSSNERDDELTKSLSAIETRPILTNLSVNYNARNSGVGSRLVEQCEKAVLQNTMRHRQRQQYVWGGASSSSSSSANSNTLCSAWNRNEIVLEVEEDNLRALEFYKKRGYKVLFEDPTSRRYDVSGLWLSQKRCKRYIMRKVLGPFNTNNNNSNGSGGGSSSSSKSNAIKDVKLTFDKGLETLRRLRDNVLQAS